VAESKDIQSQQLEAQAFRDGITPVQFVDVSVFILLLGALRKVAVTHSSLSSFFRDDFTGRRKTLKANSISAIWE